MYSRMVVTPEELYQYKALNFLATRYDNLVTCAIVTVKSNIVTMTNWIPSLAVDRPRYVAIADAIAADLAEGKLKTGDRLPPQRELAWRLGVTVGTITRAYQEAERRGLLSGEVGRGSYLKDPARSRSALPNVLATEPGVLQMHIAAPPRVHLTVDLDLAFREITSDRMRLRHLDYGPATGAQPYREMGVDWLRRCGVEVSSAEIVVTAGAHAALIACLAATLRPGDHLLAEPLTYPTLLPIARLLGLQLHALEMDEQGMIPASLEQALDITDARVLYVVPTLHNPTTTTLTAERRQTIAAIAKRHGLTIIEDDIFRLLAVAPPPDTIHALAPERTYYITSLSKTVAPGLRVGFVATPPGAAEPLALQQMIAGSRVASLTAEMARLWMAKGAAERILTDIRNELAMRRLIALNVLGGRNPSCAPGAMFLWLPLPDHWRAGEFARATEARGIRVTPGSAFAVGRRANDQAVRICFGLVEDRDALKEGLQKLDRLLGEGPAESFRAQA
jgi:DNA-binding transcriptional MocR family regulator